MKTKHILTALALPALFAACTAEDIVNDGNVALQERPTVQNLTVRVIEGAESRYAVSGTSSLKFNFETGDKFGAAIIDEYQPGVKPENWEVIPSLAGNTPFTYNANSGEWKAPADLPMGLGHYLFVYPYNRADVNRAAVSYELPAVQKLYTEEDGEIDLNAAIEASNKSFYSTVVTSSDVEDLDIDLKNLYAYPKFVINFDNGEKVTTVSKVVLAKKGGFEVKGGFNHEVVAALFADEETTGFYDEDLKATDWNKVQTADVLTTDEDYAAIETSPYLVAELPLDAEVEKVTNNKVIEVRFMIPGVLMEELADFNDYEMYIYTDNGVYAVGEGKEDFEVAIAWKNTTKESSKLKAFARGTANTITINKNYVVKAENEKYIVTSIADWNALVEQYGDEDKFVGDDAVNVVVVGGSLVLDETAEMPTEAEFKVDALTIEGEVELCNVIAEKVTVAEDATLTTCKTFSADQIINKGELVISAVYNTKGKAITYDGINAIFNYATVNVEKDAITEFFLSNQKGAVLNNNGTISIYNENAAMTIDGEIQYIDGNNGTINNEGTINMGNFVNLAPEYKGIKLVNMPTINNEGKILTKGDVINLGTVKNEGTLSCKNQAGTFNNENVLDAKEDGLTYITENNGEVIVYAPFQEDVVIEEQNGTVSYTTNASSEAFYVATTGATSYVNNIYVSDDYTLTATNGWIALNVMDDATITRKYDAAKGYLANVAALNVLNGTTILGSDFNVNSIYVEEDAMVRVPAGKTLNVGSSVFNNKGEIEVAGNFAALSVSGTSTKAGVVTESGANAEIYWKENADEWNAATTKKEALTEALIEYMNASACNYDDDFVLDLAKFNKHLSDVQTAAVHQATYPKADTYFDTYGETEVTESELNAAAGKIASDNKKTLVEKLETMKITLQDAKLYTPSYKNNVMVRTAKANAYDAFREDVVKNEITTGLTNAQNYAANALSETEIDAILAEAAPYAYIWEGCVLDQLADLWVAYDGEFTKNDYDANGATLNNLVAFFKAAINGGQALHAEVREKMPEGVDLLFLSRLAYTDEQVAACCGATQTSTVALAVGLN